MRLDHDFFCVQPLHDGRKKKFWIPLRTSQGKKSDINEDEEMGVSHTFQITHAHYYRKTDAMLTPSIRCPYSK